MMNSTESFPEHGIVCTACRGILSDAGAGAGAGAGSGLSCAGCGRKFPVVAGLLDLRLESDRYLRLDAERARAEQLAAIAQTTDLMGLASAYYDLSDESPRRRARFLKHIAGGLARGEALAARLPRQGTILEVGCGTGGLLVAAARRQRAIIGVDIAARWLVAARRRLADHGLSVPVLAASAETLPWPDRHFDVVVVDSVLEHLEDPTAALHEWARVLRPGGRLVVWSPNRRTLTNDPHLGMWGLGWLPRPWLSGYLRLRGRKEWPPRTLSAHEAWGLAAAAGLGTVEVDAPAIPAVWSGSRPWSERSAIRAYNASRGLPGVRGVLRTVGPLWELCGTKTGKGAA